MQFIEGGVTAAKGFLAGGISVAAPKPAKAPKAKTENAPDR